MATAEDLQPAEEAFGTDRLVAENSADGAPGPEVALVMVADDDPALRAVLRHQLQAHGHRVVEATGGGHALEILRREPVDVALVDLRMPGFDGFDFLRAWREACTERYVPVVLVTGSSPPADVAAGLGLGAHDCVRKPFEAVELLARVGAALEGKRLHDDLRRQNEELRRASRTDPLTGVHNRRHLEEELAALVSAARRHRTPLGVLVVDIDRFKQINEQGGHLEGDDVLRSVADRIRSAVRAEDVICRWGGDEFLIILPCTGDEGARSLGERIRHEVTSAVRRPGLRITVSIGYASAFDPDGPALVGAADMALFRAKAAGRNQVRG